MTNKNRSICIEKQQIPQTKIKRYIYKNDKNTTAVNFISTY